MEPKKCYQCRKPTKGNKILCEECLKKPREKGTSTLVIWNKV